MKEFTVVTLSSNNVLHDNIIENYQSYESARNIRPLSKLVYEKEALEEYGAQSRSLPNLGRDSSSDSSDKLLFSHIDSRLDNWLDDLSKHIKIDVLILDDDNLQNFLSQLLPFIDSKVNKLVNLSNCHLSTREIRLPKPLVLFELLEIIDNLRNADGMFRSLSSGWIYCSNTARLQGNGDIIKLTDKESTLIEYLLSLNGYRSSKSDLLEKLWNYNPNSETSTLNTHLYKLRQKLPKNMFIIDGNACFLNV